MTAPLLPAAVPGLWPGLGRPGLICPGAASRLTCLMGVQLGFMGVQLGGKGHLGWFARVGAAVREHSGSSGEAVTMSSR